jgi:hypothetical protein
MNKQWKMLWSYTVDCSTKSVWLLGGYYSLTENVSGDRLVFFFGGIELGVKVPKRVEQINVMVSDV